MSTLVFKCVFLTHEHRSVGRVTVSFSDICSIPSTALKAWSWPYVFNSIPWVHYTHTNTHCVAVIANINKAICSNLLNSQWNLNRFGLYHFWLPQWLNQIVDYYCCCYYQRKKNSKRASTQEVINMDVVIRDHWNASLTSSDSRQKNAWGRKVGGFWVSTVPIRTKDAVDLTYGSVVNALEGYPGNRSLECPLVTKTFHRCF